MIKELITLISSIPYITRATIAERAKSIAMRIVALKRVFSKPLLVCPPDPSPPPKALPSPASDCCIRIAPIKRIDKMTWMIGNICSIFVWIISIDSN